MIELEQINKKYGVILADPPWAYRDKRKGYGGADAHYSTMSMNDIKNLPVGDLAEDDCFLFLWATFPNLDKIIEVFPRWGFVFKTLGFGWVKTNRKNEKPFFGVGHYTKSNLEVCLIGTRGRPKVVSNKVSNIVISPILGHSQKPPEVIDGIEKLCGDVSKIELFARETRKGWDSWGLGIDE